MQQKLPNPAGAVEIYRSYDDLGMVRVLDDGHYRYLAFGDGGEQSCVRMAEPAALVHQYTQAMILGVCLTANPQYCVVIGVGAGSLITALQRFNPELSICGVEIRQLVVDVARSWFAFTPSEQVEFIYTDAASYLYQASRPTDLLFIDIFDDQGIDESLLDVEFIEDAYQSLSADGVLVINLWQDHRGYHRRVLKHIRRCFSGSVYSCSLSDGNLVIFACKGRSSRLSGHNQTRQLQQLSQKVLPQAEALFRQLHPCC